MLVRLLGFITLDCGCVVGRYQDVATHRDIAYVEDKGDACVTRAHRRNHTLSVHRRSIVPMSFRRMRAA